MSELLEYEAHDPERRGIGKTLAERLVADAPSHYEAEMAKIRPAAPWIRLVPLAAAATGSWAAFLALAHLLFR